MVARLSSTAHVPLETTQSVVLAPHCKLSKYSLIHVLERVPVFCFFERRLLDALVDRVLRSVRQVLSTRQSAAQSRKIANTVQTQSTNKM